MWGYIRPIIAIFFVGGSCFYMLGDDYQKATFYLVAAIFSKGMDE